MTQPAPPKTKATASPRERNREQTTQRILAAVGEVLVRDGVGGIGVNAVAQQAGVDKVLIYRYFGGLPELLRAWGQSGRFWPSVDDLLAREPLLPTLPPAQRYVRFFEHFIEALRARPLTLELLAAEMNDRNELTVILETEREQWGAQVAQLLGEPGAPQQAHTRAMTILLIGAVQYMLLRARTVRTFGGIELRTQAGWAQFKQAIHATAQHLFEAPPATNISPGLLPPDRGGPKA